MNNKLILNLALMILLGSCNQVYKEYEKESFSTLSWKNGQQIIFYPEIKDVSKTYELTLGLRHTYGAQIKRIDVSVKVITPSGQELEKEYGFDVMDDKGEYLASCAGNMCDIEKVVDQDLKLTEPGKYQFIVSPVAEQERIRGIMEFGLIISERSN